MKLGLTIVAGAAAVLVAVNAIYPLHEQLTWERIVYSALVLCLLVSVYFQGIRMPWAVSADQAATEKPETDEAPTESEQQAETA